MPETQSLTFYLHDALSLTARVLDHIRRLGIGLHHLELNQTTESTTTLRLRLNGGERQLRLLERRLSQIPGIEHQLPETPMYCSATRSVVDFSPPVERLPSISVSSPG